MNQSSGEGNARDRLIVTARRLFGSRNYGSVGVQELCEEADVRRGSFYYHFASKQDLALAALDADWQAQLTEIYAPAFTADVPTLETFDRYQDLLYEFHHRRWTSEPEYGGCLIASIAQETALTDAAIRDRAMEYLEVICSYFEGAMGRAIDQRICPPVDTKDFARRVLGYVQGVLAHARVNRDPECIASMRYEMWKLA